VTRGLRIARIFGIDVILDYSWFLISFLIAWSFARLFQETLSGLGMGSTSYLVMGVLAAALFFASILAHEISHALVAISKGIKVRSITLFIFGGVAEIKKEAESAGDEFKIAAAGPLTSLVLGVLFLGAGYAASAVGTRPAAAIFALLGEVNIVLAVFNMLPGFPLDGGRVLRAAVWKVTGDMVRGTRVAATGGQVLAWALIAIGVFRILAQGQLVAGVWMILIGLFLYQAATTGYQQLLLRRSLRGLAVDDLMTPDPVSIPGNLRISEAVDQYFLGHRHTAFPVTGYGDQVEGLVTLQQVRETPRDRWPELTVRQIMFPLQPSIATKPSESLSSLVDRLDQNPLGRFLVMEGDRLAGILSASDIARHFQIRASIGNGLRKPV
jgi:Zn-dependent protease